MLMFQEMIFQRTENALLLPHSINHCLEYALLGILGHLLVSTTSFCVLVIDN